MRKFLFLSLIALFAACNNASTPAPAADANATPQTPAAAPAPAAPAAKTLPAGKFVSTEDPLNFIEFKGNRYLMTYDKELVGDYEFNYDPTCANCKDDFNEGTSAGDDHAGCFRYVDQGDVFAFIILEMDNDHIDMSMIGGRGNTNSYVRVK